jgi:hypothetical protein
MIFVIVGWSAIGAWRMMTRDACRWPKDTRTGAATPAVFQSSPGASRRKLKYFFAERAVVLASLSDPPRALRHTRHGGQSRSRTRRPVALNGIKAAVIIVFISVLSW